jgi:3-methyladenine DNA glycosylase AlkD
VLDFQARKAKLPDEAVYELYLNRHDAIDSWDMVDRAAPHVVGRYLLDRPRDPLFELAASADPLRRRTAITAPLYFARFGTPDDLPDLFALARLLLADTDPVVSKPVGIALKYAGVLDEPALLAFLDEHGGELQRPALRYAVEKLEVSAKARYLG